MFTSEILQLSVSLRERTLPSFHLVVCFLWRSKVSRTEPHKLRRSGVLTLEQFQGHTNGQMGGGISWKVSVGFAFVLKFVDYIPNFKIEIFSTITILTLFMHYY